METLVTSHAAFFGAALFFVIGLALLGYLKRTVVESLMQTVQALKLQIEAMKTDRDADKCELEKAKLEIGKLKMDLQHVKTDGELKSKQLAVTLRVIEYFEHVVTTVIKDRQRIPAEVMRRIDAALLELTLFRKQAALDLESLEINEEHYTWLMTRAAIMGPRLDDGSPGAMNAV